MKTFDLIIFETLQKVKSGDCPVAEATRHIASAFTSKQREAMQDTYGSLAHYIRKNKQSELRVAILEAELVHIKETLRGLL